VARRTKAAQRAALSTRELHAIARVLFDPRRFEILKHIAAQPCLACSDPLRRVSHQCGHNLAFLKELESAGLIETTRRGKFVEVVFCRTKWQAYLGELEKFDDAASLNPARAGSHQLDGWRSIADRRSQ